MPFSPTIRQEALTRSKRHCCVCQEFAGRSTQVHHIKPEVEGGPDELDNAIVLCLRCHAEAGHYNSQHPIGNKYTPKELRQHRDEWWNWCANNAATIPPRSPIMITPTSVALIPGEWARTTIAVIHNRSDRPLFQIWIKVSIPEPLSFGPNLEITPFVSPDATPVSFAKLLYQAKFSD